MGWRQQFPADFDVPRWVTDAFEDISYGNDAAPKFQVSVRKDTDGDRLDGRELWVDHPDPTKREFSGDRFVVMLCHYDSGGGNEVFSTEDEQELIKWLTRCGFLRSPQEMYQDRLAELEVGLIDAERATKELINHCRREHTANGKQFVNRDHWGTIFTNAAVLRVRLNALIAMLEPEFQPKEKHDNSNT